MVVILSRGRENSTCKSAKVTQACHFGASVWLEDMLFWVQMGAVSIVVGDEEENIRETNARLKRACSIPKQL